MIMIIARDHTESYKVYDNHSHIENMYEDDRVK